MVQGPTARRAIHLVLDLPSPARRFLLHGSVGIPTEKDQNDMALRLTAKLISTNSGPLNYALVGFTFDPAGPVNSTTQLAMRVMAYLSAVGQNMMEEQVLVDGIVETNAPVSGGTDIAFDPAVYATLITQAATAGITIRPQNAYGGSYLGRTGGTSSGRGDSLCVQTKTTTPGRKGRGRHFLPFLARESIAPIGLISNTTRDYVEEAYGLFFLGRNAAIGPSGAVVLSKLPVGSFHPVTGVKVTVIPSRLRSRTR